MTPKTITLTYKDSQQRLDQFLSQHVPELSRSKAKKLIDAGQVQAEGLTLKAKTIPPLGTVVTITLPQAAPLPLQAEAIPLDILYQDDFLLVVNKPAGMVVHPAPGHPSGTLVNALLHYDPQLKNQPSKRPGLVHRLDKDTSGVLVVGRNSEAVQALQKLFKQRHVEKIYIALVHGQPSVPTGLIDVPIGRDPNDRQRMAAQPDGRPAQTRFHVTANYPSYSLLEINLLTGRTHQIRVHLSWLNHPVVGDTVYGPRRDKLNVGRQFLHAHSLSFVHPQTQKRLTVTAPLPPKLNEVLAELEPN